ncbi:MAG: flagellar basal body P-ring protein FlgI [Planctomycetota bacterium]
MNTPISDTIKNGAFLAAVGILLATGAASQAPAAPPQNSPPANAPVPTTAGPQPAAATAQAPAPMINTPTLPGRNAVASPAPVRFDSGGQTVLSPRIRNITKLANSMPHYLSGIGLVTGLAQTGSSDRATRQAIVNYIQRLGLNTPITDITSGTTALVSLSCELPPFAKEGMALDVRVKVMTDATSLRGGTLETAELQGVDGQVYVVAAGKLTVAGFSASGQNASVQKNPNANANLLNGGLVVREENTSFYSESGALELTLLNPSPYNSLSIANGINTALAGVAAKVESVDPAMVRILLPASQRTNENAQRLLGMIGNVRVPVQNPAKVVVNQVSGTVLAGEGVLISPCVVGISELTIAIVEEDFISQPLPFANGQTSPVGRTRVEAETNSTDLQPIGGGGATVSDLLQNLKTLGLTPAQLVSVFEALDQGGFLHADLEVQ